MAKVTVPTSVSQVEKFEDFRRFVGTALDKIVEIINGRIGVSDNLDGQVINVTFSQANVELAINHNLKRSPQGYIQCGASVSANLYDGGTGNTSDVIYLKSSAAGTVKVFVF